MMLRFINEVTAMLRYHLFLTLFTITSLGAVGRTDKPVLSKTPLTGEQNEIYGVFLDSYLTSNKYPGSEKNLINLSDRTYPFKLSDFGGPETCLKDIELNDLSEVGHTIHLLNGEISKGRPVTLIDRDKHKIDDPDKSIRRGDSVEHAVTQGFKSGVLSMSEIIFDTEHRFAVFKYGFYCGPLCGQGGMVVFEKEGEKWKRSKRSCSMWIS
jgi:hypothetical protein